MDPITQRHRLAGVLVAALTALLTGSFVGSTGLVMCVGTNGHRALELEHPGMECPTLAGPQGTSGVSLQPPATCLDVPAAGTGPTVLPSLDLDEMPAAPLFVLPTTQEPAPLVETKLSVPIEARAGPLYLTQHLRSTVLLV